MTTHYIPCFTRAYMGLQQAFCGVMVEKSEHAIEPTCEDCQRELARTPEDVFGPSSEAVRTGNYATTQKGA